MIYKAPWWILCAALATTSASCRAADAPPAKTAPNAATSAKPAANGAKQEPIDFFKAGQTWGFLGDSITHGGDYHQNIQLFLATRYPGRDIWTRNFGRSGDSAKGILMSKRVSFDMGENTPDIVFVHLGMNDVGRSGYEKNKQTLPRTKETGNTANYAERMEQVADQVRALGAQVVIVTPTIYDDKGGDEKGRNYSRGLDEQLGVYGEVGGELAARKGYPFIDVHTPMDELSAKMRATNASWTLARDRVHPTDDGHEIFAYYILKSVKPQPYVYRVEIDAAKDKFEAQGATVVEHKATAQKVSFTLNESALPFPLTDKDDGFTEMVPFVADLNQQTLRVAGLEAGRYDVRIDGASVAQVEAIELAAGINLATNDKTPQYQAAMKIRELISPEKRVLERAERDVSVRDAGYWPQIQLGNR